MADSIRKQTLERLTTPFLIGLGVAFIVICYAYFRTRRLVSGPYLAVTEPVDGATATTSVIHVRGSALNISNLELDGRQIYTSAGGVFDEEFAIPPGYTIIELRAKDKLGRETVKDIRVVRKVESL